MSVSARPIVDVIIPALDEEEAVAAVVRAIPPTVRQVVVADNGSTDRTAAAPGASGLASVTSCQTAGGTRILSERAGKIWSWSMRASPINGPLSATTRASVIP